MESFEDYAEEKTEVIYGAENIINKTLQALSRCKRQVDNCVDSSGPSIFVMPNRPISKAFQEIKRRRIRLRFIAEITKDNIPYCKDLMKIFELGHLDEVKGKVDHRISPLSRLFSLAYYTVYYNYYYTVKQH